MTSLRPAVLRDVITLALIAIALGVLGYFVQRSAVETAQAATFELNAHLGAVEVELGEANEHRESISRELATAKDELAKVNEATRSADQSPKAKAMRAALQAWGSRHLHAFENLISRESGFDPDARNGASGACGLFQAYPCSKILKDCPDLNVDCQIRWGITYITKRYQHAGNAWRHWLARVPINGRDVGHWY